jgi:hypothetical protein
MREESNKCEPLVVFAPISQLKINECVNEDSMTALFEHGLLFTKMEPKLRRVLIEESKVEEASNRVIELLLESELIFWASLPQPLPPSLIEFSVDETKITAALFSLVAGAILKRIYNCLMIFDLHKHGPIRECWFCASGSPGQIKYESIKVLDTQWEANFLPCIGPEFCDADKSIKAVGIMWNRLLPFINIEKYMGLFQEEVKWKGYLDAAEKYAKCKADEFAHIRSDESGKSIEPILEGQIYDDWLSEGAINAFGKAVMKLNFDLENESRGRRLIRAMQFLSNSVILPHPHRFIAVITCFECLFSKEPSEVTHQLATRTSWFLYPDDSEKRYETYNDVITLYKIRSNIVHGRTYDISNAIDDILRSEFLIRSIILKILSNDEILKMIFDKNPVKYDKYLAYLSLGKTNIE